MKKLLVALLLLMLPMGAMAGSQLKNNKFVSLAADETIEGNYFVAGERVDIAGTVNGDLIAAGGVVNLTGNVTGDIIATGGTVRVSGTVKGDLRIAGGEVTIASVVGKNATVAGGAVYFDKTSAVGESLAVAGGAVDLLGTVEDNVRVAAGALVIAGSFGENLWAKVGEVDQFVLQPTAAVGGDLSYQSPTAASILSGATVEGQVDYKALEKKSKKAGAAIPVFGILIGLALLWKFSLWLGMLVLGLLLIHFVPKAIDDINAIIARKFWPSFGWGLLTIALGPILTIVLFSTLVLWPVAVVVLLVYIWTMIAGVLLASIFIGQWCLKKMKGHHLKGVSLRWSLVLGLTLLMIIASLPFLGWLFKLVAMATAIGAGLAYDQKELKRYR